MEQTNQQTILMMIGMSVSTIVTIILATLWVARRLAERPTRDEVIDITDAVRKDCETRDDKMERDIVGKLNDMKHYYETSDRMATEQRATTIATLQTMATKLAVVEYALGIQRKEPA